jgi:hypothetical protein
VVALACLIRKHAYLHISHHDMAGILGCDKRTVYTITEEAAARGWIEKTALFEGAPYEGYRGRNSEAEKQLRHRQVPNAYSPGPLLRLAWKNWDGWKKFYAGGPAPPHHNNKDRSESDPTPVFQEQVYKRPHRRRSKESPPRLGCASARPKSTAPAFVDVAQVVAEALAPATSPPVSVPAAPAAMVLAQALESAPCPASTESSGPALGAPVEPCGQARLSASRELPMLTPDPSDAPVPEPPVASPETDRKLIEGGSKMQASDDTQPAARPRKPAARRKAGGTPMPARPVIRPFEHDGKLPPWYFAELRETGCRKADLQDVLARAELWLRLTGEGRPEEEVTAAVEDLRQQQARRLSEGGAAANAGKGIPRQGNAGKG